MKNRSQLSALLLMVALGHSGQSQAQDVDAGSILREQPGIKQPDVAPSISIPGKEQPEVKGKAEELKFLVKGFRFIGVSLVPEQALQTLLIDYTNTKLTLSDLKNLANKITQYYASQGFIARVFLPPQDLKDGIITYTITEGQVGEVKMEVEGDKLNPYRIKGFVGRDLDKGEPMKLRVLGKNMNILNEQPGIKATASMQPGTEEGHVDLVVKAEATPLVTGALTANNHGSRSTGEVQTSGSVTLNNPTGHFDAATALVNVSKGVRYISGNYSLAVGNRGLRLGANASYLDYKVTQKSLSTLNSHGDATVFGLTAMYPVTRFTDKSLSLNGSFNHKALQDFANGSETGDRTVDVGSIGLSGWRNDGFLGKGITSYGISLTMGNTDLSGNVSALASDQATRNTDGHFNKLSWNVGKYYPLNQLWQLSGTLRGQIADGNLDSTERLSLGGPSGVRAYPVSEASGDEGWLSSLTLTRRLSSSMQASAFIDHGQITLNKHTWDNWNASNSRLENHYALSGIGVSWRWQFMPNASLNMTLAKTLGHNPGRSSHNLNADSRDNTARGWINLQAQF